MMCGQRLDNRTQPEGTSELLKMSAPQTEELAVRYHVRASIVAGGPRGTFSTSAIGRDRGAPWTAERRWTARIARTYTASNTARPRYSATARTLRGTLQP
eukprot:Opistho-1_new@102761